MIDGECYSCKQASEDYYGEYEVSGLCVDNYEVSGKCETELRHHLSSVNRNACNWIHGIQITPIHSNGIIHARYHGSPKAAMAIASFATLFVILAFYVSYLNSQLAMKKACDIASYREGRRSRSPNKYRKIKKRFSFSKLFKKKNKKTRRQEREGRGGQRWSSYLEIVKEPIPSIDEFFVGGGFLEESNRIGATSKLIQTVHEGSHC